MSQPNGYYHGDEADQYTFYRLPKTLFTNERYKNLSDSAKILYGLMLDRMGLSIRNGWMDEQDRVYIIFTLDEAQEYLNCKHEKAVRMFAELDAEKGVGLIKRVKRGQGKPSIIYVLKFFETPEIRASGNQKLETSEKQKSGLPKNRNQNFRKTDANKTNINNTDLSNINSIPIHFPNPLPSADAAASPPERKGTEAAPMTTVEIYRDIIRENIDYPILLERHPYDRGRIDELVDLMLETVCTARKTVRIAGDDYPAELVKSKFLKLDYEHIEFALDGLKSNTTEIRNIKKYLLAVLFNAPATIDNYYTALVAHNRMNGPDFKGARIC